MLTPPNKALADRDPDLPGLALLLNPDALAAALGTRAVTLRHLRYKPATSCAVAVTDADGRWHRLRALTEVRFAEKDITGRDALTAARIECATPAKDRDVPGLRRFWPESSRSAELAGLFGEHPLATALLQPLSYRLGRRLVARLVHPAGDALLKLHAPDRHAQALTGAMTAAAAGQAPLLRACSKRLAVVTGWVPGRMPCAAQGTEGLAEAGAALARLHGTPVAPPFTRSRADEVAALQATLSAAVQLAPEMAEELDDMSRRLSEALAASPADFGPIHGDFSADQVVIGDAVATLIDRDRAGQGDRACDLGSALARLDADRLWDGLSDTAARAAGDALLDGYAEQRDLPPAWEVQRLTHLAALIGEPFRRQLPDWPGRMLALIDRVRTHLDGLELHGPCDTALPQLATLLSRGGASNVLVAAGIGASVASPRLLRHKPGRRAMVELPAQTPHGPVTWLAKTRSKRPDHATPALHSALRAASFDGRPEAAFGVPEMREGPEGMRTVLIEHVAGTPLADWQVPGGDTGPFTRAGRALAALHAMAVDPGRAWTHDDEVAVADRALAAAALHHPDSAKTLAGLRDWLRRKPVGSGTRVLLHRDFYPDQVLVADDRLWLIDLDLAACGERHVDLGNMLAHLTEFGIRAFGDPDALSSHGKAFLDGYRAGGGSFCTASLNNLHVVSLLRHLMICDRIERRSHVFQPLLKDIRARLSFPLSDAV